MAHTSSITGLILAGGRAARMGSVDKGLQPLAGLPMVQYVLARLTPQVDRLAINANRNLERYQDFGVPVWPDDIADFAGPLAGIQTGLLHCESDHLATAPCDSPLLPHDLIETLHHALIAAKADLAFAVTGPTRRRQPVFSLMKTSLHPQLTQFLQHGGRKVEAWHATLNAVEVHFPDEAAFCNINTLDDLQQFEAHSL